MSLHTQTFLSEKVPPGYAVYIWCGKAITVVEMLKERCERGQGGPQGMRKLLLAILMVFGASSTAVAESPLEKATGWLKAYDADDKWTKALAVQYLIGLSQGVEMVAVCDDTQASDRSWGTYASQIADKIRSDQRKGRVKDGITGELRAYVFLELADRMVPDPSCRDAMWLQNFRRKDAQR